MYKNFNLTESERKEIMNNHMEYGYRKPLNEDDQSQMQSDIQNMIQTGVIGRDIVPLPPNEVFGPNVFGSYHCYKHIRRTLFKEGTGNPIAYYKITEPEAVESVKNAKYNRGNGKPLRFGYWDYDKNNHGIINIMGSGTDSKKENPIANRLIPDKNMVLATIPTPKEITGFQKTIDLETAWFVADDGNIYIQFLIKKPQADAYIKLMEEVVKIKEIPDPEKKQPTSPMPPTTNQQPLNEAQRILKKTFYKFIK
jgi:hypothetical protein